LLILEFDKFPSRVYVLITFVLLLLFLSVSRFLVQRIASRMGVTAAFRQRILCVNWTEKAANIAKATINDPWNPYEIIGAAPPGRRMLSQSSRRLRLPL
jgi:FlaA1/EpsC-like NDP-sugar epimerase